MRRGPPPRGPIARRRLLAALALLAGCAQDAPDPRIESRVPAGAPTLLYVHADDCPYCLAWERDFQPAFAASALRARLHVRPLRSPTVRLGAYPDAAWPEDLRWVRDDLRRRRVPGALPLFVLVHGGRVVASVAGDDPRFPYGWHGEFSDIVAREAGAA